MKIVDLRLTGLSGGTVEGGWAKELAPEDDVHTVVEVITESGLVIRARITKEEFQRQGLVEDHPVSFQIREYRVLAREGAGFDSEVSQAHQTHPAASFAEGI